MFTIDLERHIPKSVMYTPSNQSYFSAGDESEILCPSCECSLDEYYWEDKPNIKYCPECGQRVLSCSEAEDKLLELTLQASNLVAESSIIEASNDDKHSIDFEKVYTFLNYHHPSTFPVSREEKVEQLELDRVKRILEQAEKTLKCDTESYTITSKLEVERYLMTQLPLVTFKELMTVKLISGVINALNGAPLTLTNCTDYSTNKEVFRMSMRIVGGRIDERKNI